MLWKPPALHEQLMADIHIPVTYSSSGDGKWVSRNALAPLEAQLQRRSATLSHARIKVAASHSRRWLADYVSGCLYPRETSSSCARYRECEYEKSPWRDDGAALKIRGQGRVFALIRYEIAWRSLTNLHPLDLNLEHEYTSLPSVLRFIQVPTCSSSTRLRFFSL